MDINLKTASDHHYFLLTKVHFDLLWDFNVSVMKSITFNKLTSVSDSIYPVHCTYMALHSKRKVTQLILAPKV